MVEIDYKLNPIYIMYVIELDEIENDISSQFIEIPEGHDKPKKEMDESQLEAYYYDRVALNTTHNLSVPT